jgi:hypothetical protein
MSAEREMFLHHLDHARREAEGVQTAVEDAHLLRTRQAIEAAYHAAYDLATRLYMAQSLAA